MNYTIKEFKNKITILFLLFGLTAHASVFKHVLVNLGSTYDISIFCNPPQSGQFSVNIDGAQLYENHIYEFVEGSQKTYYLVLSAYSYGEQNLGIISPDNISDMGLQSSLCQPSSTEFHLYKLGYYGSGNSPIYCQDQPQGEIYRNIETGQILQENFVYSLTVNGSSPKYLVLDVLSPNQAYPEMTVSDVQMIGHFSQICEDDFDEPADDSPIHPINESFESSLGQWINHDSNAGAWMRDAGGTPTSYTGPNSASSGNYYAYAEANNYSYNASLESPWIFLTPDNSQFEFDYHMMGQGMGKLSLEISVDKGLTWLELWSMQDDQGSQWHPAIVDLSLYEYEGIKLRFKTNIGQTFQSDIAVDNINFTAPLNMSSIGQTTLDSNENYIYQMSLRDPVSSFSGIDDNIRKIESVTYHDGLGRPKQSVAIRSGGKQEDIITPIVYDHLGKEIYKYLPYANSSDLKGAYMTNAINEQELFYNTNKYEYTVNPYVEIVYDESPKQLVIEKGAPGNEWNLAAPNVHSVKQDYELLSGLDNVMHYSVDYNSSTDPYKPTLINNGFFMNNQGARPALFKLVTKNENWQSGDGDLNTAQTFVDYQNRTLMKREFVKKNSLIEKADTYFVYDDFSNLIFVLTPEAKATSQVPSLTTLENYCYQYKYDGRNRLIEKKSPGKEKEYVVYSHLGHPIMAQDGELRKINQWQFIKYDDLERVIYTGLINSSSSRSAHQSAADSALEYFETRKNSSPNTIGGAQLYYTNNSYPSSSISEVLTIQYYDAYLPSSADGNHSRPSINDLGETLTTKLKGSSTVSRVKVLESNNPVKWINTTMGYDKYGRLVWSNDENEYLMATTEIHYDLDFDGSVLQTKTNHTKSDVSLAVQLNDFFNYDHMGRIKEHSQEVNSEPKELILRNFYDELGQLKKKQVGGNIGNLGLQEIDYKYNIRGWLRAVNNIDLLGKDVFAFKLNYNDRDMSLSGTSDLYNGNISEVIWRSANTETYGSRKRGYGYSYDELGRITNAYFRRATSGGSFSEQTSHYNVTGIHYDLNGNISHLARKGIYNSSNQFGTMDDLNYIYQGNQLIEVNDNSGNDFGFKDKSNSYDDYSYDDNGNLIYDFNKGITAIEYNHLNLPKKIFVQSTLANGYLKNVYSATGEKLEKYNQETGTRTYYNGGFVYKKAAGASTKLAFFHHPEGYVEVNSANFQYIYQYIDHLGNIRLNFADTDNDNKISPGTNELLDEKHYYPFGLEHKGYITSAVGISHNYGYNGNEELPELSLELLDFNARNYDGSLGRFLSFDPLASDPDQVNKSPYAFSWNNPIKLSDPTGMIPTTRDYAHDFDYWREVLEDAAFYGQFGMKTYIFNASDELMTGLSGSENSGNTPEDKDCCGIKDGGSALAMGPNGVEMVNYSGYSNGLTQLGEFLTYTGGVTDLGQEFLKKSHNIFGEAISESHYLRASRLGKFFTGLGFTISMHNYLVAQKNGDLQGMKRTKYEMMANTAMLYAGPVGWGLGIGMHTSLLLNPTMEDPVHKVNWQNTCFIAGTMITMEDGSLKRIEDIKVGDKIKSMNMTTMMVENDEVIIIPKSVEFYDKIKIEFDITRSVVASPHHPFFVKGKGWSVFDIAMAKRDLSFRVRKIEVGDSMYHYEEGILKEVVVTSIENMNEKEEMYNIKYVKKNNTFFANGILVHNRFDNQE